MTRRTDRIASLIQDAVGKILLGKLSDPRIDPARVSVTRVDVPADLLTAKVYVSVLGTEGQQRRTLRGLRHAAGHVQELVSRRIQLRTTPVLEFVLDTGFKKTLETLEIIRQASDELRRTERQRCGDPETNRDEDTP